MKKMFSLMLAVLLLGGLMAACGDSAGPAPEAPSYTVAMPGDSSTPPETPPEPEPEPLERAFLTGLEKGPDYPEGKRITAVMLNNQYGARPQNGTASADMIVEVLVEYGITRMMAIYDDYEAMPEKIGGLRSARDQYLQLIIPYWAFFVHEGPSHASHPVNVMMDQYDYRDFDVQAKYYPIYNQDSSRSTEQYNWYDVSGASIAKYVEETGADPARTYNSPIFDFVPYSEPPRQPADGEAPSLAVTHSGSTISYFDYDAASGKYAMSQYGGGGKHKTVDNLNSQQLAFENVLVLFAPMDIWPNTAPENLPKFNYGDGGVGYYFSQGRYELVLWRKGAAQDPLLLYTVADDGQMVKVNTGKTYLAMVNDDLLPDFDAMVKGGTADEVSGQANADEGKVVD